MKSHLNSNTDNTELAKAFKTEKAAVIGLQTLLLNAWQIKRIYLDSKHVNLYKSTTSVNTNYQLVLP